MLEKDMTIACNGKIIAAHVLVPIDKKEKAKGMYGLKATPGLAMVFLSDKEKFQMFNMLWINQRLGYIALDENKRIVDLGVLKPWRSFKIVKCMYFIEVHPTMIEGLKKGDILEFKGI